MQLHRLKDLAEAKRRLKNAEYNVKKMNFYISGRTAFKVSNGEEFEIVSDYGLLDFANWNGLSNKQ